MEKIEFVMEPYNILDVNANRLKHGTKVHNDVKSGICVIISDDTDIGDSDETVISLPYIKMRMPREKVISYLIKYDFIKNGSELDEYMSSYYIPIDFDNMVYEFDIDDYIENLDEINNKLEEYYSEV